MEAGLDEAGRGCLAGPVYAAAVILHRDISLGVLENLNDSKKLTSKQRNHLKIIIQEQALDFAVAWADNYEIDRINILNASILAMHRALDRLKHRPQLLLIDGNRFHSYKAMDHHCIIKGDGLYYSIAAASVLAKTFRDEFMERAHHQFPEYNWLSNKGYPTTSHKESIRRHGLSPLHRRTFKSGPQLELKF